MIEVTDNSFESLIVASSGLTVIDVWSPWCRPCNILNPVINSLAEKNKDVVIGKLNMTENPIITNKFNVSAVPTILFFKEGKLVDRILGYQTEAKLQSCIDVLK